MSRTPAPALTEAEAARVAVFDAAPTPPECDPERVETVARAIYGAEPDYTEGGESIAWEMWFEHTRNHYRRLAAAAIAALPPSPADLVVKRVEALADVLDAWRNNASVHGEIHTGCAAAPARAAAYGRAIDGIRAALASPAPAPQDTRTAVQREIDASLTPEQLAAHQENRRIHTAPQGEEGQR